MNLRLATLQRLAILCLLGLALAYLGLLRPLARQVLAEDGPITNLVEQLGKAMAEAGLPPGTSFAALGNRLRVLRASSEEFATAVRDLQPRFAQPPEIQARLAEPFQLVEFLNESQRRIEELQAQAQAAKTILTPGLARGFPSYRAELARPELLWVQLALMTRTVRTAIRSGLADVRAVAVEPLPVQELADYGPAAPPSALPPGRSQHRWASLRLHLTAVGTVDAVVRLLAVLARTPEELEAAGLPEELGGRPALFVDHVMIRRHELQAPELVLAEIVVSTLVPEDEVLP